MSLPYEAAQPRRVLTAVSADGTHLHVEEYGRSDGPTVVLAHGWTCSTLFWAPIVRALSSDFRLIAYDQRGHGLSAAPATREGYGTGVLADDLQAVLEAVLPDGESALLVGHSMGGMTIMAAADRQAVRARTAAALLVSTGSSRLLGSTQVLPPRLSARWLRRAFHRQLLVSRLPLGPVTPVAKAALKYGVMSPGSTAEQVAFCARIVHACKARQRSAWGKVLAVLDLDAELAALTVPTGVLVGTVDKLTPKVHAHRMAAALPHCTGLTELPGRGHMTPVEDTPAVEAAIRALAADHLVARDAASRGATTSPAATVGEQTVGEQEKSA
ncbi:Pimeloyl-ACP methyl ester carboxylesterase [Actinacidiphila yanglinensis]|uniref:Pimeloyl-ACP methyl ester carboxylesterase n=1 Tax=Actinacidiphila yanglinensis TaxID=310779 RepID=A0A1H5ZEJ1_9ACTN|nr:alpha/beta hydrolase [Actinacidiphila yanglinensis]SEG34923.1 Pimeloyl-ACP methyl ester carboxylesterase [Actinacidiphila yanglinensis]